MEIIAKYDIDTVKKITLPDGITFIGQNVFHCCSALTNVTIPQWLYRDDIFEGCDNLKVTKI